MNNFIGIRVGQRASGATVVAPTLWAPTNAETQTILDGISTEPILVRKVAIDDLITRLKGFATNIWTGLDVLRIGKSHEAIFSRRNWVKDNHHETVGGAPTWTEDSGYTFNGSTQYGASDYVPSVDAVAMTQNSATMFLKVSGFTASATQKGFGGSQTGGPDIIANSTNAAYYSRINSDSGGTGRIVGFLASGWIWLRRKDALNTYLKINGTENTKSYASTGLLGVELGEMVYNNGGAFNVGFMEGKEEVFGAGRYFTDVETAEIEAALVEYEAVLAANPNIFPITGVTGVTIGSMPTGARLSWTDSGSYDNEIYLKVNGGTYTYLATVPAGVGFRESIGHSVGDVLIFKIRAKNGTDYSVFTKVTLTVLAYLSMTSVQPEVIDNVSLLIAVNAGKVTKINWGYGADISITANGGQGTYTSVYPSANKTYTIGLYGEIGEIIDLKLVGSEVTLSVQLSEIGKMTKLAELYLLCYFYGAPSDLPASLTYLNLYGYNSAQVVGTDGFPPNLEELYYNSSGPIGTWTWNIANFPATLRKTQSTQAAKILGDIANLPAAMTNFNHWGQPGYTLIEGDISTLKEGLLEFHIEHAGGAVIGDIGLVPTTLVLLFIVAYPDEGYMHLTGSISALFLRCPNYNGGILASCGDFTGSIDGAPATCTFFWFDNNVPWSTRQVTGDIANAPQCTGGGLTLSGHNLTGDLKNLLLSTSVFGAYIVDNGGGITATAGVYPIWSNQTIYIREGLTTAEVDALLIGYAGTAVAGAGTLTLTGGTGAYANQPRSVASDAAVATLQGLGKTITCTRA